VALVELSSLTTSIVFSSDGATLYVGTEAGKLIIRPLRGLSKPPKQVIVSENGCRVEVLCMQVCFGQPSIPVVNS
jgi:hypothetical protein